MTFGVWHELVQTTRVIIRVLIVLAAAVGPARVIERSEIVPP